MDPRKIMSISMSISSMKMAGLFKLSIFYEQIWYYQVRIEMALLIFLNNISFNLSLNECLGNIMSLYNVKH